MWRYPGHATIIKHSLPEVPKEGEMRNNDKTTCNTTYGTSDAQTKKNCNSGTALERSVKKNLLGVEWGVGVAV